MVRPGQPARESKTIGRCASRQRRQDARHGRADARPLLVVLPPDEDPREGRLARLLGGDEGHLRSRLHALELVDEALQRTLVLHGLRIDEGEVVIAQRQQLRVGTLGGGRGEHRFECATPCQHLRFRRRQGPSIQADVVDGRTAGAFPGAASIEPQRGLRANGSAERIHFLVDPLAPAVVVDPHAFGLPGAVVRDQDVVPPHRRHGSSRHDPQRVLVPGADHLEADAAALQPHVPPASPVGHVRPGQQCAVDVVGELHPGGDGEGLIGLDVAERPEVGGHARRQTEPWAVRGEHDLRAPSRERERPILADRVAQGGRLGAVRQQAEFECVLGDRRQVVGVHGLLPCHERGVGRFEVRVVELCRAIDLVGQRGVAGGVLRPWDAEDRRRVHDVAVHGRLRRVPEERRHAVEVLGADRIELVIVAARAPHGQPQPDLRRGLDAIGGVVGQVLLGNRPAFVGAHARPDEPRRDQLGGRRPGQQVAGNLFVREPIEGLVGVEGVDDPVAIGPDAAVVVEVVAVGVGIAHGVEPVPRPVLAVARTRQQAVDQRLVRPRRRVAHEGLDFLGRRRQARQVERDAPDQRVTIGLRIGRESCVLQTRPHEAVDGMGHRRGQPRIGERRAHGGDEGPVRLVGRALRDPALEQRNLAWRQGLVRLGRRHHRVRVARQDAPHQRTARGVALDDHRLTVLAGSAGELRPIEAKIRLACAGVDAMAAEAVGDQDRADVSVEGDRAGQDWRRGRRRLRDGRAPRHVRRHGRDETRHEQGRGEQQDPLGVHPCCGG